MSDPAALYAGIATVISSAITASAFTLAGRGHHSLVGRILSDHAAERERLVNKIIAKTAGEFAALQRGADPATNKLPEPQPRTVQIDL